MNKGQRTLVAKQKFVSRLRRFGFIQTTPTDWNCYRTTSTPCSCWMCSPGRELVKGVKKRKRAELEAELKHSEYFN